MHGRLIKFIEAAWGFSLLEEYELSAPDEEVVPLHAHTYFNVSESGEFCQYLIYDYYDPEGYYASLEADPDEYAREMNRLWDNMQGFLDEEKNEVNGEPVHPEVVFIDLGFRGREELPFVTWVITFRGNLVSGLNTYVTWSEEEELDYDCEAIWVFPEGAEIVDVRTLMEYEVHANILSLWARERDIIGGYEEIIFRIP